MAATKKTAAEPAADEAAPTPTCVWCGKDPGDGAEATDTCVHCGHNPRDEAPTADEADGE